MSSFKSAFIFRLVRRNVCYKKKSLCWYWIIKFPSWWLNFVRMVAIPYVLLPLVAVYAIGHQNHKL
ncbi:hypothetical protein IGI04_013753 [Brassica rapa subsp. trilocularis]|uniref:Uncharacterized protein n=1 Tax=Brassica rapa subsp. trilocularis TaxID=1813537 RepID=A0ABQ7N9R3_BRACM|nr:hypothetical protein IGI04_013753 [Brassica rapa subsp. trilocularis]